MPTLPTITVTDPQSTRILDAYKALYGTTTTAETVAAYKKELTQHVVDVVLSHERQVRAEQDRIARDAAVESIRAELPDPNTVA